VPAIGYVVPPKCMGVSGSMAICNVVFDIGNVIVRWDPAHITAVTFGSARATPQFVNTLFGNNPLWKALNRGTLSEDAAKPAFCEQCGLSADEAETLFFNIKDSLTLIPQTVSLIERLTAAGYRIFALSDNVHELVAYLKQRYDFWRWFEGAVISADTGYLKPEPEIYQHLLAKHKLQADETLFLDDVAGNVAGAQAVGIHALQFTLTSKAEAEMRTMGLAFAAIEEDCR
jgi:putative hydrolase of the HAD superfamily